MSESQKTSVLANLQAGKTLRRVDFVASGTMPFPLLRRTFSNAASLGLPSPSRTSSPASRKRARAVSLAAACSALI